MLQDRKVLVLSSVGSPPMKLLLRRSVSDSGDGDSLGGLNIVLRREDVLFQWSRFVEEARVSAATFVLRLQTTKQVVDNRIS